jgi:hypothetical protein
MNGTGRDGIAMPSPDTHNYLGRQARVLFAAALVASVLLAAPAHAFRLRGVALSHSGGYVTLVFRVREAGTSLYGKVRCIGHCLAGRYQLNFTVAADGSFTGAAISGNGHSQCNFAGALINGSAAAGGLEGQYTCARNDGVGDTGTFRVTP